jgi:1-acyl-sn-glycerol-3-phosphate acyltransferase
VGKGILKPYKKTPYFIYGNHTQDIADAFIPNMLSFPQRSFMIVHPNNVSMPVLGKITPYLGAIPLPDDIGAYRNFIRAIEKRITQGSAVVIYPEAHIWPYYTGIRNFPDTSFDYPVKFGVPCFCFTNTYHKRLFGVNIEKYIDGPFFPDTSLPKREQKSELRKRVYGTMCERAKKSDFELIKYIKQVENTEDPDTENAKGEKEK